MVALASACTATPAERAAVTGFVTTTSAVAAPPGEPSTTVPATTAPTTVAPSTTTVAPSTTTVATTAAPASTSTTAVTGQRRPGAAPAPSTQPAPRTVHEQAWTPFAAAGGGQVVLHHPSARVERVGFHESNHDGARDLEPLPTAASPVTLEGRHRGTGERTAVDVVVDPDSEIRAPVTGQVRRAGTYVLYCDNRDDYVVIEPDARPGWEVKVLHIDGVRVRAGQRVVAAETVLAPRATRLPFKSQVDEVTAKPPWPHVHIEIVDPTIRDRPSGRGC